MKIRYKRNDKIKPVRKKIPNLLEKVRIHIIHLRDHGYEDAIKNRKHFFGIVTKEKLASHFGVRQDEISHCLHKLNLEGLVSQPIHKIHEDGWAPDIYRVLNCVIPEDNGKGVIPLFNYHKCPICDEELNENNKSYYYNKFCNNKCFEHYLEPQGNVVKIFGEKIEYHEILSKGLSAQAKNKMYKKISYWKKNYRYLIKIMGSE